jgi:16S rRNA (adenine1518-N6/adenine1519-N6)-dimethyltransferase
MPARVPGEPHRAKKSLGQNFLADPNLQRKIVQAIEPGPQDEVLEIGPGLGALTKHLAPRVGRLILVELDDDLARRLATEYEGSAHVLVVHDDILRVSLEDVSRDPGALKVVGNIPYNITTPIIFHLLERERRPATITLMMQREVAERLLARPGSKTYGALAVGVQAVADVQRVAHVGRSAFRPAPDVDSTVVRITPRVPRPLDATGEAALRVLTRTAFGKRRKQFQRILRDAFSLSPADVESLQVETGFDLRHRPESFSPPEFVELADALRRRRHLDPATAAAPRHVD